MLYQHYEIIGSEKPIYKVKPEGLKTFSEIPSILINQYEEVAYLEHIKGNVKLYEPLYFKGDEE